MGGGTAYSLSEPDAHFGLSPRGRGNLMSAQDAVDRPRSIPAWAGEPQEEYTEPVS